MAIENGGLAGMENRRYDEVQKVNLVQKVTLFMVCLFFGLIIIIIAVASATFDKVDEIAYSKSYDNYGSLGLPRYEGYNWDDVLSAAENTQVTFAAYYGIPVHDAWIEDWLAPELLEKYKITLKYKHLDDTSDAVDIVMNEANTWKNGSGTIDMIWINGANFYNLKSGGYAYGPWSTKVPSADLYNWEDTSIKYDFGYLVNGFEMPYTGAQVIFITNEDHVSKYNITTMNELYSWIGGSGSGNFTYAAPCYETVVGSTSISCKSKKGDYTGSVFIRQVLSSVVGDAYSEFNGQTVDETLYSKWAPKLFKKLRALEPDLYTDNTNPALVNSMYPMNQTIADQLFAEERIFLTHSYNSFHTSSQITAGEWGNWAYGTVFTDNTIANTNYIAIPNNAPNLMGAIVAGNFIGSAAAMYARAEVQFLQQVYDPTCDTFAVDGWQAPFDLLNITHGSHDPTTSELSSYRIGEISNAYASRFEVDWYYCVLNYNPSVTSVSLTGGGSYDLHC